MSSFPFSSLPNEIKTKILDVVPYRNSSTLFHTNKHSREHYLRYGLLPKKINGLLLNIHDDHLSIQLSQTSTGGELDLEVKRNAEYDQNHRFGGCSLEHFKSYSNSSFCEKTAKTTFSAFIVSTIRSCRTLKIRLNEPRFHRNFHPQMQVYPSPFPRYLQMLVDKKLLSNIRQIADLEIHEDEDSESLIERFLKDWECPSIDKSLAIETPNENYGWVFEKKPYNRCEILHLQHLDHFSRLSSTHAEFYTFDNFNYNPRTQAAPFFEAITAFMAGGATIPGKNPEATVVFVLKISPEPVNWEPAARPCSPATLQSLMGQILCTLEKYPKLGIEWIDPETGLDEPSEKFDPARPEQVNTTYPVLQVYQKLEKKFGDTHFGLRRNEFYLKPTLVAYFQSRLKNLIFIARICQQDHCLQLQFFVKSMRVCYNRYKILYPSDYNDFTSRLLSTTLADFYIFDDFDNTDRFFETIKTFIVGGATIPGKKPSATAIFILREEVSEIEKQEEAIHYKKAPMQELIRSFDEFPEVNIKWINPRNGQEIPGSRGFLAKFNQVRRDLPILQFHQELEEKLDSPDFERCRAWQGAKDRHFYVDPLWLGYFRLVPKNLLLIARICEYPENLRWKSFQLQLIFQSMPSKLGE